LNSGLGENHPKVKAIRATKAVYVRQLEQQVASVRDALQRNLNSAQTTRDELKKQLADINEKQVASKNLSSNYTRAKNAYIKEKTLRDNLRTRTQTQTMEMAMPRQAGECEAGGGAGSVSRPPARGTQSRVGRTGGTDPGHRAGIFYRVSRYQHQDDGRHRKRFSAFLSSRSSRRTSKSCTARQEIFPMLRPIESCAPTSNSIDRALMRGTISIVSGGPGEGKSTTLVNLAVNAAQGGYSTLIVDADLRRPVQHTMFDVDNKIGLTNYLTTDMPLEDAILSTKIKNLSLLPSGALPADAVGILNSQRMSDLIAELKTRYDIILFDSPPMLGVSDASVLASEVDHSIIVVQHRRFSARHADASESRLSKASGAMSSGSS
jgi:capsular exopolysaccharide synthesis family protein